MHLVDVSKQLVNSAMYEKIPCTICRVFQSIRKRQDEGRLPKKILDEDGISVQQPFVPIRSPLQGPDGIFA